MHLTCEFCDTALPGEEPENVAFLVHVTQNDTCREQFDFMLDNLRASWTPAMSGG